MNNGNFNNEISNNGEVKKNNSTILIIVLVAVVCIMGTYLVTTTFLNKNSTNNDSTNKDNNTNNTSNNGNDSTGTDDTSTKTDQTGTNNDSTKTDETKKTITASDLLGTYVGSTVYCNYLQDSSSGDYVSRNQSYTSSIDIVELNPSSSRPEGPNTVKYYVVDKKENNLTYCSDKGTGQSDESATYNGSDTITIDPYEAENKMVIQVVNASTLTYKGMTFKKQ